MKRILLLLTLLTASYTGFSQTTPGDTTKKDTAWKIHGQNTFLINQSSFTHWAAGGANAFAANVVFDYDFNYKKDKWSWDNKVIVGYGLSKQAGTGWRKNDDRIILNSLAGYKAAQYWLYTFYANFQTQFTKGYNYNADNTRTLISAPFAPAYLTFGPGFAYKKSDNFRVNISPLAARITMVSNDSLSNAGSFGVTSGDKSLFEFGASLDGYLKFNIATNITFENALKLYSNYLKQPGNIYADYTGNIFMKVNKLVTVNFGVELISDPNAKIPVTENGITAEHSLLQVKQIFGAGLTYKF
ncbi:DUF3078 domain-containing protein [Mucilaginibacter ginsenosidivorans]|uniref:DUF3078 domain-containing protein n=1 Tax=Mucilaginibacter ginsenosidivorans TaxID=398053 RepID=A0A5B8UYN0_9SPHI|nr:DUF3078 domain-containing protein [Mucilaginibacter ginsenosidivorans]QEC63461.1 DUF3078 domain-containing protein [Mucilaginibacter ginsenosidivorans]